MATIQKFTAEVKAAATQDVSKITQEWQRRFALAALNSVVLKTPVDTGRARANWQAGPTPGELVLEIEDTAGAATLTRETPKVQAGVRAFKPYVVWNNVEYINFLEDGSSKQAPQGMVALTIRELQSRGANLAAGLKFRR